MNELRVDINWIEMEQKYPLAHNALKHWFLITVQAMFKDITIESSAEGIYASDGQQRLYLQSRDLHGFFDLNNLCLFIEPGDAYPTCRFYFRSPKKQIKFPEEYPNRLQAEIIGLEKAFQLHNNFLSITAK